MKPDFDKVLKLVIDHGEPSFCKKNNCLECDEIENARDFYNGKKNQTGKFKVHENVKCKYVVSDENGNATEFYVKVKAMKFVKASYKKFNNAIATGELINGYRITADKLKGDEV